MKWNVRVSFIYGWLSRIDAKCTISLGRRNTKKMLIPISINKIDKMHEPKRHVLCKHDAIIYTRTPTHIRYIDSMREKTCECLRHKMHFHISLLPAVFFRTENIYWKICIHNIYACCALTSLHTSLASTCGTTFHRWNCIDHMFAHIMYTITIHEYFEGEKCYCFVIINRLNFMT